MEIIWQKKNPKPNFLKNRIFEKTHKLDFPIGFTSAETEYGLGLTPPSTPQNFPAYNRTRAPRNLPQNYDPRVGGEDASTCAETQSHIFSQGSCGSCWAFGAVYSMSDSLCKASGVNGVYIAHQHIGSCSSSGDMCGGGWHATAMNWALSNYGVVTGDCQDYKMQNHCHQDCDLTPKLDFNGDLRYGQNPSTGSVVGVDTEDYDGIKSFLMDHGSLVMAIQVESEFYGYSSGVFNGQSSTTSVNHALTAVGWEGSNWIAKNSWGDGWGDGGWVKFPIAGNVLNQKKYTWYGMMFSNCPNGQSIDEYGSCVTGDGNDDSDNDDDSDNNDDSDSNDNSDNNDSSDGCDVPATPCDVASEDDAISDNKLEGSTHIKNDYTYEEGNAILTSSGKQSRVVNGYQVTNPDEAPYYVRILSCATGSGSCSICGASWISPTVRSILF